MTKVDFVGLGAQRAGTSWTYSCLYEHPELCLPYKEIHFFSRERNWKKGFEWYEEKFEECPHGSKKGEFSTSYLTDERTPERIRQRYPNIKLIVILRDPVERAFSNYRNQIKEGKINSDQSFKDALTESPGYIERGLYGHALERYLQHFDRKQLLVLFHEDSREDPEDFLKSIYRFLETDLNFSPSLLDSEVNPSRTPRSVWFENLLNRASEAFQKVSLLRKVWWIAKKSGLGRFLRSLNTSLQDDIAPSEKTKDLLYQEFEDDIILLEKLLGKNLDHWKRR